MPRGRISTDVSSQVLMTAIARAIDSERPNVLSSSGFAGVKPFVGRVAGHTFRVQRRHANRNGLAAQLHGEARANGSGSTIDYVIEMNRQTRVVLLAYFALVSDIGLALSAGPQAGAGQLPAWLWASGALLVGVLFVLLGRIGWTNDVSTLESFLKETVRRAEIGANGQQDWAPSSSHV